MKNDSSYTLDTLPNNLPELRTGTANDGRMLIKIGPRDSQQRALRDIRARLPKGWTAEVYEPSGIDAVITHVGEVAP
jgi:hypothetical protein